MHPSNRFSFTTFLHLLVVLFTIAAVFGEYVVIRNPRSGLVLDASGTPVLIQHFVGSRSQTWKLEATSLGVFYITNQRSGFVMDVNNKINLKDARVIVARKTGSNCQLWYINSDITIANVCGGYVLDIAKYNYVAGNYVVTYPKHSKDHQKFVLQFLNRSFNFTN